MSPQPTKPGKSSKTKIVLAVLAALALNAAVYFFWIRHASAEAAPAHSSAAPVAVLHLETFTLNIDDPEQRTYLRVGIDLGLDYDPKDQKNAAASPTAVLRDTILNVLMATKPQDVTTVEGKRKLKEQILAALKERVPDLGVREIYFTEFLVQR